MVALLCPYFSQLYWFIKKNNTQCFQINTFQVPLRCLDDVAEMIKYLAKAAQPIHDCEAGESEELFGSCFSIAQS